jgi:hypothetical protein
MNIKIVTYCIMWLCATLITMISICSDTMTTSSKVNGTITGLTMILVIFLVTVVFKPFNK